MGGMERHLANVRRALETHGLLSVHDPELPSVTRIVSGAAIRGSWWGHPSGKDIFHVLGALEDEDDVATAKLVGGKVTLVHDRLLPALVSVGRSDEPWQSEGLRDDARALLTQVTDAGTLRTDRAKLARGSRKIGAVADDLERRLLVASVQVHTETGQHARAMRTWARFMRARGIRARELPSVAKAREALAAPVIGWVGAERAATLLPW